MRINVFYGAPHDQVLSCLESFWAQQGKRLTVVPADVSPPHDSYQLHAMQDNWTPLWWTIGWEWDLRRQAQLHVSRTLDCPGILIFVYDGDYWGYELFHHGEALDHFVQRQRDTDWFPGHSLTGRPELLVAQFPELGLTPAQIAPYLIPEPEVVDLDDEWDAPAQPGDEFSRGSDLASLSFLRRLGIGVDVIDRYVTMTAPVYCRFTVEESA